MKLVRPYNRSGLVARPELVDRLESSPAPVVAIVAPAGYGKTSLLCQWDESSRRPFAWVTVDPADDDPHVLASNLAKALSGLNPADTSVIRKVLRSARSSPEELDPALGSAISSMATPFVLVIDSLEALRNRRSLRLVATLCLHAPEHSRLVLSSRSESRLPLGRLRAQGRLTFLGRGDLAMDALEAAKTLTAEGIRFEQAAARDLWVRTEGWPVALYLATQSAGWRVGNSLTTDGRSDEIDFSRFRGDDRLMADYLRSDLLARVSSPELTFMMRTSMLDRMSGPICDAVLKRSGSRRVLQTLEATHALVVPMDRTRTWYRYQPLVREFLQSELARRDAGRADELALLASEWCEANGDPAAAVGYAQLAGEVDRVAGLTVGHGLEVYQAGQASTVEGWLDWLLERDVGNGNPQLAELAAWVFAFRGRPAEAERWADAAERGAEGEVLPPTLAVLRAVLCRRGVERMRSDAEHAIEALGAGSPWQPMAALLLGVAHLLTGENERADLLFADAADEGARRGPVYTMVVALAERAVIAVGRGDWAAAGALSDEACAASARFGLEHDLASGLGVAISARVGLQRGDIDGAREKLARARLIRPMLSYAVPHLSAQTLLELAHAHVALADARGARSLLRDVEDVLRRRVDLGSLAAFSTQLRRQTQSIKLAAPGASTLTAAEIRLLPYLATHLSFREIAEKLFVSTNTVRTQASSVYRKLIVTSRSQAIDRAREFGLLAA